MAEDIEERNQRPKLELTGEHVHLVAFAIAYDREVQTDEIDFVLGRNFLLTAHPSAWDPWTAQHLREGAGPLLERGADFLLWALLDALVDAYFPVFDRLEDEIDDLEDRIVDEPGRATLERLFALKRSLVEIRHVMAPQREIFNQLTNRTLPLIAPDNIIYFRDVYDHAVHLADEYDSYRELVSGRARCLPLDREQQPVADHEAADRDHGGAGRDRGIRGDLRHERGRGGLCPQRGTGVLAGHGRDRGALAGDLRGPAQDRLDLTVRRAPATGRRRAAAWGWRRRGRPARS